MKTINIINEYIEKNTNSDGTAVFISNNTAESSVVGKNLLYFGAPGTGKSYAVSQKIREIYPNFDRFNDWSLQTPKLSVVDKYVRENPDIFSSDTIINITQGHRMLVVSIWQAFRCPLTHQMFQDLSKSGLYTDGDCLDALGILSHLFRRLDNSELVNF